MSLLIMPTKGAGMLAECPGRAADTADQRYKLAQGLRHQMNKVFPTHWSHLIHEISLSKRTGQRQCPPRAIDVENQ